MAPCQCATWGDLMAALYVCGSRYDVAHWTKQAFDVREVLASSPSEMYPSSTDFV